MRVCAGMDEAISENDVPGGRPGAKTCLLIIPRHFYSFEQLIREALEAKGYSVVVSNDEYPEGLIGKLLGKLQIPLIFPITYQTLKKRFLEGRSYDLVLIFKGRGISKRLIAELKRSARRVVGYNWDSFRLNRSPLKWYDAADKYFTFDYRDGDRWSLPIIELFSSAPTVIEKGPCSYQLSTVVRNHSRRIAYIDRVVSILRPESVFISIFEMNKITFLLNFVRSPRLYIKYWRNISFTPLPYSEYSKVMNSSEFTIDFAHDTQTGITMRCFEAINMKTKIITNNEYMVRSRCFSDGDYLVFRESDAPGVLLDQYQRCRGRPYESRPRSIADFVSELIAE